MNICSVLVTFRPSLFAFSNSLILTRSLLANLIISLIHDPVVVIVVPSALRVEEEYRELKIKTAIHMYGSDDPAVKAAALADQGRRNRRRKSIMKDAEKYAEQLGLDISTDKGKIKSSMQEASISQTKEAIANQPWLAMVALQSRGGNPKIPDQAFPG